ncbi:IncQ-type mobilization protein MobB [Duganella sp. BJB476]|uniref:IncQ-type mobilization protein MobB n=1 Tax=Duganella sp. BJB476 TaxID=1871176 RepID=UPI001E55DE15|nr:IncQ-type mobilization protein MobB [Duganella sp. BJB476]
MTKSDTVRQLAAASDAARVEALNQTLLEPLAQAMATLTDETRASLEQIAQHSREQGEQFRAQVEAAITSWINATIAAERVAERLDQAGQ